MSSNRNLAICMVAMLFLAGCAKYKSQSLKKLDGCIFDKKDKSEISFSYHIFNKRECIKYAGRNVIKKGYQPIQITLTNNSNRYLSFSPEMFSFPCAQYEEVVEKILTSTTKRAVGYGVGSLFVWPLIIPAIVDGVGSHKANKRLIDDFREKTLKTQTIDPYSVVNGLVFVPTKEFKKSFSFSVSDKEKREKFVLSTKSSKITLNSCSA